MIFEMISLYVLTVLTIPLSLKLVPDRWNRIDVKAGLSGFSLSAEELPNQSE
jgi:hypothetical protein